MNTSKKLEIVNVKDFTTLSARKKGKGAKLS